MTVEVGQCPGGEHGFVDNRCYPWNFAVTLGWAPRSNGWLRGVQVSGVCHHRAGHVAGSEPSPAHHFFADNGVAAAENAGMELSAR